MAAASRPDRPSRRRAAGPSPSRVDAGAAESFTPDRLGATGRAAPPDRPEEAIPRGQAELREALLLGDLSNALASTLDYEETVRTALGQIVPALADQCAIDVLEGDGSIRRVIAVEGDSALQDTADELAQRYAPRGEGHDPVVQVIKSGRTRIYEEVGDADLERFAQDARHLALLRRLQPRSAAIVPMVARGRTIGALSLAIVCGDRRFTERDRGLIEEVARRLALAIDNARLYREAREQVALHAQLNTAMREAAEARDRALASAQEALELRDRFLTLASHELRTPITSLRGYAQLLLRQLRRHGSVDPVRVERALQLIDLQSDKLSRLAMQLLDTSRIETGTLVLDRAPADLAALVREVVASRRDVLAINAPVLQVEHTLSVQAPESLMAMVDRTRLEQVLINLLDNAIKYTPNGGTIEIDLAVAADGRVRCTVRDYGIGVSPPHQEKIFERFYQAQRRDNPSGMGLGLYTSRQIVELHGGTLTAEFPDEGGSRFVITLPAAILAPPAGPRRPRAA